VLYEWNGTGLARVHSNECAYCGPLKNSGVLVKNCGTAHGLFETALPCTN
jgi:ribosomal protein L32